MRLRTVSAYIPHRFSVLKLLCKNREAAFLRLRRPAARWRDRRSRSRLDSTLAHRSGGANHKFYASPVNTYVPRACANRMPNEIIDSRGQATAHACAPIWIWFVTDYDVDGVSSRYGSSTRCCPTSQTFVAVTCCCCCCCCRRSSDHPRRR
jgi:hypothetical protein